MENPVKTPLAPKVGDIVYWRTCGGIRSEVLGGRILELSTPESRPLGYNVARVEITCRKFRDWAGFHEIREVYAIEDTLVANFMEAYNKPTSEGIRCGRPWYLVDPSGVPCTPGI